MSKIVGSSKIVLCSQVKNSIEPHLMVMFAYILIKIVCNNIFKRNAKAFSFNAIVDVRRRRCHEILETIRASDFKIYDRIAFDSLYISTGNDVIYYFQSEANRTNV